MDLLREGIRRGLISEQFHSNWPQNVWSVSEDNEVFEAQLENKETGAYHGYPVPKDDDFGLVVVKAWDS